MMTLFATRKYFLLALIALCFAPLVAAYIFEFIFHKTPCHLCLYERYPYVFGFLGSLCALLIQSPRWQNCFILFIYMGFLAGFGITLYHIGIEYHLIELPHACTSNLGATHSLEAMKLALLETPIVRCDIPAIVIFGLSLTVYNGFYLLGLFFLGLIYWRHRRP